MQLAREKLEELRKAVAAGDTVVPVPREVLQNLVDGYNAPGRVELLDFAENKLHELLQLVEDERETEADDGEGRCDYSDFHVSIADFREDGPYVGTCRDCNEPRKHANHVMVMICKQGNEQFWAAFEKKIAARRAERETDQRIAEEGR